MASSIGVPIVSPFTHPTAIPAIPLLSDSIAKLPSLEARILSKALGEPPLWSLPKTSARVSNPVSFSILFANSLTSNQFSLTTTIAWDFFCAFNLRSFLKRTDSST